MKLKALLCLLVCASWLVIGATGCKRREQVYADIKGPPATETVEPNVQY